MDKGLEVGMRFETRRGMQKRYAQERGTMKIRPMVSIELYDNLLEAVDELLARHEFQTNSQGAKWCDRCIGDSVLPMSYSWQHCEMNELRAARQAILDEVVDNG